MAENSTLLAGECLRDTCRKPAPQTRKGKCKPVSRLSLSAEETCQNQRLFCCSSDMSERANYLWRDDREIGAGVRAASCLMAEDIFLWSLERQNASRCRSALTPASDKVPILFFAEALCFAAATTFRRLAAPTQIALKSQTRGGRRDQYS